MLSKIERKKLNLVSIIEKTVKAYIDSTTNIVIFKNTIINAKDYYLVILIF